jgi:hypothetical protein
MALTQVSGDLIARQTVTNDNIASVVQESFGIRNRIINGDMRIDQRNAGASVTPSNEIVTYITDRFYFIRSSSTSPTIRQSTDAPTGFTNSLLFTNASTGTTPTYAQVVQNIEGFNTADLGWGTANAQSITLSFRVKSSLTGTFSVAFRNSASNRSYVTTYTIDEANTWETKTVTIPGDTTGTWLTNNGIGISLVYRFGDSGGTPSINQWTATGNAFATGSVNVMGTANATWQITGVQLEKGTVATPFERRPYGMELALCQRYYEKSFDHTTAPIQNVGTTNGALVTAGTSTTANVFLGYAPFAAEKRASPTVTTFNPFAAGSGWSQSGAGNIAASAYGTGTRALSIRADGAPTVGLTNLSIHWTASAEL